MHKKNINKAVLKAFIQRKKINALGLLVITAASVILTLLGALTSFERTDMLAIITVLMILLCILHMVKNGRGFRTLHPHRKLHRKKRQRNQTESN